MWSIGGAYPYIAGDYGKLGRGGSDSSAVPLLIDALAGKGVVKVECGSQFSMALTRSGALYSWGKGTTPGLYRYHFADRLDYK